MAVKAKSPAQEFLFEKLKKEVEVPGPLHVTEDIVLECPTQEQVEAAHRADDEDESTRILLGDENYRKVRELFRDQPPHMWVAFTQAYTEHFFGHQTPAL